MRTTLPAALSPERDSKMTCANRCSKLSSQCHPQRRGLGRSAVLVPTFLLMALASAGCGRDQTVSDGQGGAIDEPLAPKLEFDPGVPLQLEPGQSALLAARLTPPQIAKIRFGIVGDVLSSASLSADEVETAADGRAIVTFFAPKSAGTLGVRAEWVDPISKGALNAERSIVVGSLGFGGVLIELEGTETAGAEEWRASCFVGASCRDLDSLDPEAATIWAKGTTPLALTELPAGPPLAIVVSRGNIAKGCANVDELGRDEIRPLRIEVAYRPFELKGEMEVDLKFDEVGETFVSAIGQAIQEELPHAKDSTIWLDRLAQLLTNTERTEFLKRRKASSLDLALESALAAKRGIFGVLEAHLVDLALGLPYRPGMQGRLDFDATPPVLEIASWAGVPAETSFAQTRVPWESDVAFGGTAFDGTWVSRSHLTLHVLAWLRDLGYLLESDAGLPVSEQLAASADCPTLAKTLLESLPDGEAYPGCGDLCLEGLCSATFGSIWETLGSAKSTIELDLAQSGGLSRNESGVLTHTEGSFIATSDGQLTLGGSLSGTSSPR
jgi:hypothetical protein